MTFPGGGLFLDEWVRPFKWLWVFLAAVAECLTLTIHLVTLDVGVVAVNVEVARVDEPQWMSIPGAYVKMLVAVLVSLLSDADLKDLIGGVGAAALAEDIENVLLLEWAL